MNIWETQLEIMFEQQKEIEAGEVIETYIFDKETYEQVYVKAIVSKNPASLPEGDVLWVRDLKGKLFNEPWAIKIIERQPPPWMR
jgi:hypothetical protein